MRQLQLLLLAFAIFVLAGCGGSGQSGSRVGSLAFKVKWPTRTRLIPYDSAAIVAIVTDANGKVVGTQTLPRPAQGVLTTTVSFDNLNPGKVTLAATAYPTAQGTGVAQAIGSAPATIVANQITPVTVTMADTITAISILNSAGGSAGGTLATGQTQQLTWNAVDALGDTVLVSPATITWSIPSGAGFGTITPASASSAGGLFTMLANGTTPEFVSVQVKENESGVISPDTTFSYIPRTDAGPGLVIMDPSGTHLYSTVGGSPPNGGVHVFDVSSTGQLNFVQEIAAPGVQTNFGGIYGMVITPDDKHLYVYGSATFVIDEYNIQSDGTLVANGSISAPLESTSLAVDPSGKYLYSGGLLFGFPTINVYAIGSGTLSLSTQVANLSPGVPFALTRVPNTPYMIGGITNSQSTFDVLTFTVNSDGTLNIVNDLPGLTINQTPPYVFSPDGVQFYSNTKDISMFGINPTTGVTTNNGVFTGVGSGTDWDALAATTIGSTKYLYVRPYNGSGADSNSTSMYACTIGNGTLTAPSSPAATGLPNEPYGTIVTTPNGKFLYTTNLFDGTISQFSTSANGSLTPLNPPKVQG